VNYMNRSQSARLVIVVLAIVIASVLALNATRAEREPSLAELALKADDLVGLPGVLGSALKKSGATSADDPSQPLNTKNDLGPLITAHESLFKYEDAYTMEATTWDGRYAAYIGNYLYRYADVAQAEAAANEWIKLILQDPRGKPLDIGSRVTGHGIGEQAAMIVDSEGGAMYWLTATKERTLILLMVNGMPVSSTQKVFEALANHILQK